MAFASHRRILKPAKSTGRIIRWRTAWPWEVLLCCNRTDRQTDEKDANVDRDRYRERDRGYTQMRRPTKQEELNKRILRFGDARELCDLISTHVAELNHVNVATSFRKLLQFSSQVLQGNV